MNACNCDKFQKAGNFFDVIDKFSDYKGKKATYLIVFSYQIPRLQGNSDILYIGQSGNLGADGKGRLWNYKYADKKTKESLLSQH